MSKILEMIKSEKVEWKKLGDVCEIGTGKSNTNEQDIKGKFPFYVRSKDIKRSNSYAFDELAIIIPGEGGIGEVFHYVNGKYALHQRAYRIHIINENINTRFVYHYMMQNFKNYITKFAVSATVKSIRKPMIENFEIPVPNIETQEKIVEILDNFVKYSTELQAELQAELQNRSSQYEYFRDLVLSKDYLNKLSQNPEINSYKLRMTTLGEIGEFVNGSGMPKSMFNNKGEVGAIHYGHIYTKYSIFVDEPIVKVSKNDAKKLKKVNYGDLVIAKTSENIDDVMKTIAYIGNKEVVTGGHAVIFKHKENPKYLSYLFNGSSSFLKQKNKLANGVKVIEISIEEMKRIKILLPPLEIQNKVVEVLDKFQNLISNAEGLLPEEIEQRQKQYEYYREKLLTFENNMVQVKSSQVK